MVASEVGRSEEEEDMQNMRAEHATHVAALRQEVDRLRGYKGSSCEAQIITIRFWKQLVFRYYCLPATRAVTRGQ